MNRHNRSARRRAFYPRQKRWLAVAEQLKPTLTADSCKPVKIVQAVRDPRGFQGWRMKPAGRPVLLEKRDLAAGDAFILDFEKHRVGYLGFDAGAIGSQDAPLRLKLTFAETPAEAAEPFEPHTAWLSRAWMQDEILNIDVLPARIALPRRYAFRYLKVEILAASLGYKVRLANFACRTVTSANRPVAPPRGLSKQDLLLDQVSLHTLANCMQTVFEDGPKRDRRLWMGDLRLQALTNYASFRNHDLVKRCLYLFAGLARSDGAVCGCNYEEPHPRQGGNFLLDYMVFFAPILLEYAQASNDWRAAGDLWPVARRQLDLAMEHLDRHHVFRDPKNLPLFVDWQPQLNKQAAVQGVLVFALRSLLELAEAVGRQKQVSELAERLPRMVEGARRHLWDEKAGLFVSGPERQISWASQVWMILAGIMTPEEGRKALLTLARSDSAIRPAGPYLYHHVVEAMIACGMGEQAARLVRTYWGGMLRRGATTFWEVFDPSDETLSPYGSHLINSYCHAWSCTPAYFIRRFPEIFRR